MTQPADHGMNCSPGTGSDATGTPHENTDSPSSHPTWNVERIADAVRDAVGEHHFQHWFANRSRFEVAGESLLVFVSNPFISNWLLKRFRTALNKAAASVIGPSGTCELRVDESLRSDETGAAAGAGTGTDSRVSARPVPAASQIVQPAVEEQSELIARPLAVRSAGRRKFRRFTGLISGDCNDLALMAARQVADAPGERFNPLYIHGPTGVGKTHVLEAIYSEIRRTRPGANVVYLTSESFTNYFTQALSTRTVPSFRQRFRNVDVLLVDNIEFLNNRKKATEEEFLHTIVQLIEHGGQLVVTGDRHPRLLTKNRDELTTRFMSGLVCRMDVPCEDTRRRIAASLAIPMHDSFTKETVDYVARRCRRNIREIQGALNCLHGYSSLEGRRISVTRAREILGEMEDECQRLVRISDVEKVICDAFGLTASDLRSKSRRKAVACPRSLAMYIARKLTRFAYREIGLHFGGRDHSTVVAAERRVQRWIDQESPLELPSSFHGRTIVEVVREIEERLIALAS